MKTVIKRSRRRSLRDDHSLLQHFVPAQACESQGLPAAAASESRTTAKCLCDDFQQFIAHSAPIGPRPLSAHDVELHPHQRRRIPTPARRLLHAAQENTQNNNWRLECCTETTEIPMEISEKVVSVIHEPLPGVVTNIYTSIRDINGWALSSNDFNPQALG